jgi:putative ATP-binding cassette transporter
MTLLSFLGPRSRMLGLGVLTAGAASGLCAAALIALINRALNRPDSWGAALIWGFAAVVLARVASAAAAQILMNRFSQRVLSSVCQDLSRRLLAGPLPRLEALGMPRLLIALTDDVSIVTWALQCLPGLAINAAILGGCAIYLSWLSWKISLGVFAFVVVGTIGFLLLLQPARRQWRQMWQHQERLVGHLRAVIDGVKELKLNAARREAFLSGSLTDALDAVRRASLRGTLHQTLASAWSQMLFFLLVGLLLFSTPSLREGRTEALTGFLLVAIYMINPLWTVIDTWPALARGRLAVERLQDLTAQVPLPEAARSTAIVHADWERLELKGVAFAYPRENGSEPFALGPIDFTLRPGEIVFLAGGNGSGKSTFAKLLTGLYPPHEGEIRLDNRLVTEDTREWYHAHFSAVFSDFYLFDRLLGLAGPDVDGRARAELARLKLDRAVDVQNGAFSTTRLSSGQRKRLALLVALLDDRPIYVLDEWAADQDPHYRDIFYSALLPELKRRGKAIVAITHDDRYYGLGDRVLTLADGQLKL